MLFEAFSILATLWLLQADVQPNGWAVLQTLILTAGPIIATVVTYRWQRDRTEAAKNAALVAKEVAIETKLDQSSKLDNIHSLVNGPHAAALAKIAALEAENAALRRMEGPK